MHGLKIRLDGYVLDGSSEDRRFCQFIISIGVTPADIKAAEKAVAATLSDLKQAMEVARPRTNGHD